MAKLMNKNMNKIKLRGFTRWRDVIEHRYYSKI